MKPDHRNIDEILNRYLPSSPKEETESAGARVLYRLRSRGVIEQPIVHSDPIRRFPWRGVVMVSAAALLILVVFIGNLFVQRQAAAFARIETVDGTLYQAGSTIRTNGRAGATFVLADGSRIEMRSQSELSLRTAEDGVLFELNKGSIIVSAAKQRNGHLYVRTKDVMVSVVGTVFLVNAEEAGSRVAVIQGEVQVQHGATSKKLRPGEQLSTNAVMQPVPVIEELAWSRNAVAHLALLQQTANIPIAVPPPKRLEFEVASVKLAPRPPLDQGIRSTAVYCRGVDGIVGPYRGTPVEVPQGRCVGHNVNLISLITIAYDLKVTNPGLRTIGGAPWTRDAWGSGFEIEAKAEDTANVTTEQLRQMLQSLAADRFNLKVSRQTRDVDGYALTIGRGGPKLQEASGEEGLTQFPKRDAGRIELSIAGKASMQTFADFLSFRFPLPDRKYIDRTGLTRTYLINLSYGFDLPPRSEDGQRGGGGGADPGAPAMSALAMALQEQLGLRIEPAKVPDEFIVIDHAERPSEN